MQIILSQEECKLIHKSLKLLEELSTECRGDPDTDWTDMDYQLADIISDTEELAKRFEPYG